MAKNIIIYSNHLKNKAPMLFLKYIPLLKSESMQNITNIIKKIELLSFKNLKSGFIIFFIKNRKIIIVEKISINAIEIGRKKQSKYIKKVIALSKKNKIFSFLDI